MKERKEIFDMYENLRAEIARKNMSLMNLVDEINKTSYLDKPMRYQTLSEKLRGNSSFTVKEAISIKNALNVNMSIEELFGEEVK